MEILRTCTRVRWVCGFGPLVRHCSDIKTQVKDDKVPDKAITLRDEKLLDKRRVFREQEALREATVREELLTERERVIRSAHAAAVERGHFTYDDPETGRREFTRLRHFLRGACCGSACRHCIYDHVKVAAGKMKTKRFNSAFWVYNETDADDINDEYMMSLRRPKPRPIRSQ